MLVRRVILVAEARVPGEAAVEPEAEAGPTAGPGADTGAEEEAKSSQHFKFSAVMRRALTTLLKLIT